MSNRDTGPSQDALTRAIVSGNPDAVDTAATSAHHLSATLARLIVMLELEDAPLFALTAVTTIRRTTDDLERALVLDLRQRGFSWATIASALGVTRQSAHERFGRSGDAAGT